MILYVFHPDAVTLDVIVEDSETFTVASADVTVTVEQISNGIAVTVRR